MRPEIVTERLTLRRGAPDDFDAIHAIYARPEVARMVASWPIPADPARTARVFQPMPAEDGIAGPILLDGRIIGNMGCIRDENGHFVLGYGLDPDHWGRGYATEMGGAMIDAAFARHDLDRITAGVWVDNPASARVLEKIGFHETGKSRAYCLGRQVTLDHREFAITRADWLAANPLRITTDRLVIRAYDPADAAAFCAIAGTKSVARMLAAVPHPLDPAAALEWIVARTYQGRPTFCAAVCLHDGTLIGNVGIGRVPVTTMYFYGEAYRNHGYATEAHRAFIDWAFARFNLDEIGAGAFADNTASQRVLMKLGFERIGERMHVTSLRLEPAPLILYRLDRDRIGGNP